MYYLTHRPQLMSVDWDTAQRIADHYRRQGTRVHVCCIKPTLHALWMAR